MMEERPGGSLRERILSAAFVAFMQHGYTGANTMEIARQARVSKRDLYALFGSKQAMLAACISNRAERMQAPMPLPEPHDRAALEATLSAFGSRLLQEVSRPEVIAVYRLAIAEAERAPEVARTLEGLGPAAVRTILSAMLRDAQSGKLLGPGDPGEMADAFIAQLWSGGLFQRLLLQLAPPPDAAEASRRAIAAAEKLLLLYGLRRPQAGRNRRSVEMGDSAPTRNRAISVRRRSE